MKENKAPFFSHELRKQNVCLCDTCCERKHDFWRDTERCAYSKGEVLHGLYFSGYYIPFTKCPKTGQEIIIKKNN